METRAQSKKDKEVVEDNLGSRVEKLENTIVEQNSKMEKKHIAEMFEVIHILTMSNADVRNQSPSSPASAPCSTEDVKVPMVSIHLDGIAATWHQNLLQTKMNMLDWPTYKLLLKERFDEVWDDLIAELKKLQETEDIVEYNAKF